MGQASSVGPRPGERGPAPPDRGFPGDRARRLESPASAGRQGRRRLLPQDLDAHSHRFHRRSDEARSLDHRLRAQRPADQCRRDGERHGKGTDQLPGHLGRAHQRDAAGDERAGGPESHVGDQCHERQRAPQPGSRRPRGAERSAGQNGGRASALPRRGQQHRRLPGARGCQGPRPAPHLGHAGRLRLASAGSRGRPAARRRARRRRRAAPRHGAPPRRGRRRLHHPLADHGSQEGRRRLADTLPPLCRHAGSDATGLQAGRHDLPPRPAGHAWLRGLRRGPRRPQSIAFRQAFHKLTSAMAILAWCRDSAAS
jgi:hypothetical protein